MSGTKRMFEMTETITELWSKGETLASISTILEAEYNLEKYVAESVVDSWSENRIAKNFSYDGEISYGS